MSFPTELPLPSENFDPYLNPIYETAFSGEALIHFAGKSKVILATDGLGTCIGFAGWDAGTKTGFLVHFYGPKQVENFFTRGVEILNGKYPKISLVFNCAIRGGTRLERKGKIKETISLDTLNAILDNINSIASSKIQFKLNEETQQRIDGNVLFSKSYKIWQSLSVDCNGFFSDYDYNNNLNPSEKTSQASAIDGTIDILEALFYRIRDDELDEFIVLD